jgi:hypothetical protein
MQPRLDEGVRQVGGATRGQLGGRRGQLGGARGRLALRRGRPRERLGQHGLRGHRLPQQALRQQEHATNASQERTYRARA